MSRVGAAPSLKISHLDVRFVDRGKFFSALAIDFLDAPGGNSLALTGPSGSGKSTLLYALAGLLRPGSGGIFWGELDILAMNETARDTFRRENIGFVFQDFELLHELTPLQNVLTPATFAHFSIDAATRQRAQMLLDRFNVPARGTRTGALSRGERQRVAMARALLFDPPIILADEPTASLDADSGAMVIDALADRAREDGRTVIAASHDPALIARMDGEVRLDHGRIARQIRRSPSAEDAP